VTRWLLFLALLLFAPTLVLAPGLIGTIPVGAWLVQTAGARRVLRSEVQSLLVVGVEALAWAGVWWLVAAWWSRAIQRAPSSRRIAVTVACAVFVGLVALLPIYGWAVAAGMYGLGFFQSAYRVYVEVVRSTGG